jgi:hypothetical protein
MANSLNKVTTKSILDATVATADIAADAITGAKIADDAIDSEHYTDGSIDTAHIADDAVTADKLANAINTDIAAKAVLTGSTNNTITTVTGANAIQGEANLTFDGTALNVTGNSNIINSGGNAKLTLRRSNTASNTDDYGTIRFQSAGEDNNVVIGAARQSAENDGYLFISTASSGTTSERFRINSSGNVGINESASNMGNGKLTVKIDTNKHIGFNGSQGEVGSVPALVAYEDDGTLASMGFRGTDLRFATGSAERGRWTDNGLTFNGDTAAANALDDYEEGDWNPVLYGTSSAGTTTYTTRSGSYTKIGNLVTVNIYLNWSNQTGSGHMAISSMPFTRKAGTNYETVGTVVFSNWDYNSGEQTVGYMGDGTVLYFRQTYDNEAWEGVQHDSSGELMASVTYRTT